MNLQLYYIFESLIPKISSGWFLLANILLLFYFRIFMAFFFNKNYNKNENHLIYNNIVIN